VSKSEQLMAHGEWRIADISSQMPNAEWQRVETLGREKAGRRNPGCLLHESLSPFLSG
jgi:hypothetical protein